MPSRYRRGMMTHSGSMDFDQFTDKMNELLKRAWGEDWGTFVQAEPTGNDPDKIILPIITYDTYERIRSTSHRSIDPILFDRIDDPEQPGTHIELYRQWFDMQVDFFIHHQTNRDARILMEDFENFLFEYKDYFKDLGISDIRFEAEKSPKVVTMWGKELPQRNLRYTVRIERILTRRSKNINKVEPVVESPNDSYAANSGPMEAIMRHYGEQKRFD